MLLTFLRLAYFIACAGAVAGYFYSANPDSTHPDFNPLPDAVRANMTLSFFVLLAITQLVSVLDIFVRRKRVDLISASYFGLLVGVLLAYLTIQTLSLVIDPTSNPYYGAMVMVLLLSVPYLCVSLLLQTRDDFRFIIPYVEFARDFKSGRPLLVDSSSLIDGRICGVVETRILDSRMLVPDFILSEVQDIADSSDKARRIRGRRGLEVLATLQQSSEIDVRVHETKTSEFRGLSVDQKLVELAKMLRAGVITNDFNLNKVASVQNITVINLNDVANALRPQFLPGERLRTRIMREGEGHGQGVGYLEDGTMVVCEGAENMIGQEINTVVTRVLQSSAGRMIFSKPVQSSRDA